MDKTCYKNWIEIIRNENEHTNSLQKYQRLLVGFVIFLPIYFVLQTPLRSMPDNFFTFILTIFWMMIILVYIVVVLKIINRINQLKKQGKRLIP